MPRTIKTLAPAGRKRPVQFPLYVAPWERELISRETYEIKKLKGSDFSQNDLVIVRTIRHNGRERLEELRKLQSDLPESEQRKYIWREGRRART